MFQTLTGAHDLMPQPLICRTLHVVAGLENFAWLSVASRASALLLIGTAFVLNRATEAQLGGVLPDVLLATGTLFVLRNRQRRLHGAH